ncbi:MAG TPA: hypothetical protein VFZ93_10970 [Albitalea sp.]
MALSTLYRVQVHAQDCGPDQAVPLHQLARWLDAASQQHLRACGDVHPAAAATPAPLHAPVTDAQVTILEPAMPGDTLQFHTRLLQSSAQELVLAHRVLRDGVLICEAHETRAACHLRGLACTGACPAVGGVPRVH